MDWRLAGFDELRELGRGSHGRVVLAREHVTGSLVAIKYVTTAPRTLEAEAHTLLRVANPHVARIHSYTAGPGDNAAIVLEAVDGHSLKRVLEENGALPPEAALLVLKGSLLGLSAAHGVGVVHRDYKPANVIVQPDGLSKLVDFGVAVDAGTEGGAGTPAYMAPEQWEHHPASPATDVYAATCVFYECVRGQRPFRSKGAAGLRLQHMTQPPPLEDLPEPLRPLVLSGMAKDPAERPADAADFVRQLDEVAGASYGPDWEGRGMLALAGATAALAATALTAVGAGGIVAGTATGTASVLVPAVIGIAALVVVTTSVGVMVFAGDDKKPVPTAVPISAAAVQPFSYASKAVKATYPVAGSVPFTVDASVQQVAGGDPARRDRVNKLLTAFIDETVDAARAELKANPQQAVAGTGECRLGLQATSKLLRADQKILSAHYDVSIGTVCNSDVGGVWSYTVTVDMAAARELTQNTFLRPGTLTTLARRLRWPKDPACAYPTALVPADLAPITSKGKYRPNRISLGLGKTGLEIALTTPDLGCGNATTTITYSKVRDLLTADLRTRLGLT